jgi:hypothetical protein
MIHGRNNISDSLLLLDSASPRPAIHFFYFLFRPYNINNYRMIKKSLDQGCRGINKLFMKLYTYIFQLFLTFT